MNLRTFFVAFSFCYFASVVFSHLDDHQLEFFDESRRGVSVLEMYTGKSHPLVPTYAGSPDHWGTKPPLLIWTQTAFTFLFGPGELAIRLPSALATMLLLAFLVWFSQRQWKNAVIGTLAGWVLLCNWNFVGNHGARSGDFDALLTLFTVGQVFYYYEWGRGGKTKFLVLAALSLLLAGWTKGIAGCFVLPALGLWTLLDTQARRRLTDFRLYAAFGLALFGIFSYYLLREMVDPGFLQLVWENELGGRYLNVNEGHPGPWYHYLEVLFNDRTFALFAGLSIPGAVFLSLHRKHSAPAGLLILVVLTFLIVISLAATKLFWYVTPVLPIISLLAAWCLWFAASQMGETLLTAPNMLRSGAVILFVSVFFWSPCKQIIAKVQDPSAHVGLRNQLVYRDALRSTEFSDPFTIITWYYQPNTRFYVQKAQIAGRAVTSAPIIRLMDPYLSDTIDYLQLNRDQRVLLCENRTWKWMAENHDYRDIAKDGPCKLVEIRSRKPGINPRHGEPTQ